MMFYEAIVLAAGVMLAIFYPRVTGATSLVAIVLLHIAIEEARSESSTLIDFLSAAYLVLYASVVAFFAQLISRLRNQKP